VPAFKILKNADVRGWQVEWESTHAFSINHGEYISFSHK